MQNIKSYIVAGLMVLAGLMPSIDYSMSLVMDAKYWAWWVLIAGFFGFFTMFLKVPFIIKFTGVSTFGLCFFSSALTVSFTQYIIVVSCCYFYILCLSMKDYTFIFKALQCLLLFNLFFFMMQVLNIDTLLNFGIDGKIINYGIIGQHMQSASFITILSAILIPFKSLNLIAPFVTSVICNSVGAFLSVSLGTLYYISSKLSKGFILKTLACVGLVSLTWLVVSGKLQSNLNMNYVGGRLMVWIESLNLSFEHPFTGYGIATYRELFPSLGGIRGTPWYMAHNFWVQMIFETGFIFTSVYMGYFVYLMVSLFKLTKRKVFKGKARECIAGLLIISTNMMFHFPTHTINAALLIVFFLAYCQGVVNHGSRQSYNSQYSTC